MATALAIFETIGSVVGVIITLITFFTLISKRPIEAFRKAIREESKAANSDLKQEVEKINQKLEQFEDRAEQSDLTDQAIIRHLITQIYFKYKNEKQIPHYEKENISYLYSEYKRLKGNSYIKGLMKEVDTWEILG